MIELYFAGIVYHAALLRCYDGDTCTIKFTDSNPIVATQNIRIAGIDTPEIRGKCPSEKEKAKVAREFTYHYIHANNFGHVKDTSDKYGRIVVSFPGLAHELVANGLGKYYNGGKREGWCK